MEKKISCFREVHRFNKRRKWYLKLLPFFLGAAALFLSSAFVGWMYYLDVAKFDYEQGNLLMENELHLSREQLSFPGTEKKVGWEILYLDSPLLFTQEELTALEKLEGVQSVLPYFAFSSSYNMYLNNQKSFFSWRDANYPTQTFTWFNSDYIQSPENISGNYNAVPYLDQEQMDQIALIVDETAENGAYLSEIMAKRMGIDLSSLNGLMIQFEICPPFCLQGSFVETITYADPQSSTEISTPVYNYQMEFGVPVTITVPVRGILPDDRSGGSDSGGGRDILTNEETEWIHGSIALPYQTMRDILDKYASTHNLGSIYLAYQPISYLITLDNPEDAGKVAEQIFELDPSYRLAASATVNHGMLFWFNTVKVCSYIAVILFFGAAALFSAFSGMRQERSNSLAPEQFRSCVYRGAILETLKMLAVIVPVYLVKTFFHVLEFMGIFQNGELIWELFSWDYFYTFFKRDYSYISIFDLIVLCLAALFYGLALAGIPLFWESRRRQKQEKEDKLAEEQLWNL